jgi:hypothetical protein
MTVEVWLGVWLGVNMGLISFILWVISNNRREPGVMSVPKTLPIKGFGDSTWEGHMELCGIERDESP